MSFNNLDYISKLNLENIDNIQFPSNDNTDLASFTDSSFFDFDKFPIVDQDLKLNYQQQFQQQLGEEPQHGNDASDASLLSFNNGLIKQEEQSSSQFNLPNSLSSISQIETPQQQLQTSSSSSSSPDSITSINNINPNAPHSEVDKKKRNTAASARFRIKKKLKEQEMERTLKQLTEKVSLYNSKIAKLEMENKCLKSLIIEKNEQKSNDLLKQIKERSIIRSD